MGEQETQITAGTAAGQTPEPQPAPAAAEAQEGAQPGSAGPPYSAAGAAFTSWFNERVRRLPNAVVRLGTKTATVLELHADGRLEVSVHASAGEVERQFVAFEAQHIDQLLLKFAAQGV